MRIRSAFTRLTTWRETRVSRSPTRPVSVMSPTAQGNTSPGSSGGGVLIVGALVLLAVIVGLIRLPVGFITTLLGMILVALKWGAFGVLGLVAALALEGAVEIGVRALLRRRRQAMRACPLPRPEVIRGSTPRSELEALLVEPIHAEALDAQVDPSLLSGRDLAALRQGLAGHLSQSLNASRLETLVVNPLWERLQSGCEPLEGWIARSCKKTSYKNFWLLRRVLGAVSFGHLGLKAGETTTTLDPQQISSDYHPFKAWFWQHGWPLMAQVETLLFPTRPAAKVVQQFPDAKKRARAGSTASPPPAAPPVSPVSPALPPALDWAQPETPSDEEFRLAALEVCMAVEQALQAPEPWSQPHARLSGLLACVEEALESCPEQKDTQLIHRDLSDMLQALPQFEAWFDLHVDPLPALIDAAFYEAERTGEATPETVRGHAARLYLTGWTPAPDPREQQPDLEPELEVQHEVEGQAMKPEPLEPSPTPPPSELPQKTVPPLPSTQDQIDALF